MENKEISIHEKMNTILFKTMHLIRDGKMGKKETSRINSIADKILKLQKLAIKEAKQSKGATSTDKYEPEAMELIKEAQAILDGLENTKES